MYVDTNETDKARRIRQGWLWKVQYQREARGKMILCFAVGFGIGFACCTTLVAMLERVS